MAAPVTLIEALARRAADRPDAPAFTFAGRRWTCGELWDAARRAATVVRRSGAEPGTNVLVALPNGPEFFAAFYGVMLAGATAVPVFPGADAEALSRAAQRCDASAVVADLAAARTAPPLATPAVPAPDHLAYLQYTSGSTGEPQGVMITHRNLMANVGQLIEGMAITPADRFVSWLPAYHDMGLVLMTMVPLYLGAELHLLPTSLREVAPWLSTVEKVQGTLTAAPDFAYRLCLRPGVARHDLSSLRVALNAAEAVRAETIARFEEAFGLAPGTMVAGYGLAEATVGVSTWPPGSRPAVDDRGFVSVGPPYPGVEVRIDGGGEILVAGPNVAAGYYGDAAATAATFGADGFLRTGDLGYLDGAGNLFWTGRKKESIVVGGRTIAPREIVEVADARPEVRLAAAVGVDRGGRQGEQPHVFAEVRDPVGDLHPLAVAIAAGVRAALGVGARVHLVPVGSIPLTANGKVRSAELRRRYLAGEVTELHPR